MARAQDAFALFRRSIIALVAAHARVARRQRRPRARTGGAPPSPCSSAWWRPSWSVASSCARSWRRRPSLAAKPGGRAALEEMVTSLTEGLLRLVSVGLVIAPCPRAGRLPPRERARHGAPPRCGQRRRRGAQRGRRAPRRHGDGVGRAGAARHHAHGLLVALAPRDPRAARAWRGGRRGRRGHPMRTRPMPRRRTRRHRRRSRPTLPRSRSAERLRQPRLLAGRRRGRRVRLVARRCLRSRG